MRSFSFLIREKKFVAAHRNVSCNSNTYYIICVIVYISKKMIATKTAIVPEREAVKSDARKKA